MPPPDPAVRAAAPAPSRRRSLAAAGGESRPAEPPHRRGEPAGATRTVERALDLLMATVLSPEGETLSGLARATDLSPATASRLLSTLVGRGLLRRAEDGSFHAGHGLLQIGALVLRDEPLYELAGQHLSALARETGETASLGIAVGPDRALYLRQVAGGRRVQAAPWTGLTIPRTGTAMGAALRGDVGPAGYVVRQRAVESEIVAIAAPVRGHDGTVVGVLSILAPTYRTQEDGAAAHGRLLVEHAAELSLALGAPISSPTIRRSK